MSIVSHGSRRHAGARLRPVAAACAGRRAAGRRRRRVQCDDAGRQPERRGRRRGRRGDGGDLQQADAAARRRARPRLHFRAGRLPHPRAECDLARGGDAGGQRHLRRRRRRRRRRGCVRARRPGAGLAAALRRLRRPGHARARGQRRLARRARAGRLGGLGVGRRRGHRSLVRPAARRRRRRRRRRALRHRARRVHAARAQLDVAEDDHHRRQHRCLRVGRRWRCGGAPRQPCRHAVGARVGSWRIIDAVYCRRGQADWDDLPGAAVRAWSCRVGGAARHGRRVPHPHRR